MELSLYTRRCRPLLFWITHSKNTYNFKIKGKKDINKLKNHINDNIETFWRMHPKLKYDGDTYKLSHEILFDSIDLRKYLKGILVENKSVKKVKEALVKYKYDNVTVLKYSNNAKDYYYILKN